MRKSASVTNDSFDSAQHGHFPQSAGFCVCVCVCVCVQRGLPHRTDPLLPSVDKRREKKNNSNETTAPAFRQVAGRDALISGCQPARRRPFGVRRRRPAGVVVTSPAIDSGPAEINRSFFFRLVSGTHNQKQSYSSNMDYKAMYVRNDFEYEH